MSEMDDHLIKVQLWYLYNKRKLIKPKYETKNNICSWTDPNIVDFLDNNILIVDEEPSYKYKVYLSDKATPGFARWAEANKDKIKLGHTLQREIENSGYLRGFYFWVKDDKVLLLVKMIIGGNIQRIDKLVSKSNLDK